MTHPRRTRYIGRERERERDLAHASDFTIKRARSSDPGVFECGRGGLPFAMQTITQRIARKRAHRHTEVPANGTGYRRERERERKGHGKDRKRIVCRDSAPPITSFSLRFRGIIFPKTCTKQSAALLRHCYGTRLRMIVQKLEFSPSDFIGK